MSSTSIGVFDSGVGGLTVVRALRRVLPHADIVYLGDTARVPYGSKSPQTVEKYAHRCLRFLLHRNVSMVLVACNTASATALPTLRCASSVTIIGAVRPGARAALAATTNYHIGVVGTLATHQSGAYEQTILELNPRATVSTIPCPLFVPLVEEGWVDDDITQEVAKRYLSQLFVQDPDLDTLVLGCTHYPLLTPLLQRVANGLAGRTIRLVDSAIAMAQVASQAAELPAQGGRASLLCYVTDATRMEELSTRFLGERLVPPVQIVDI